MKENETDSLPAADASPRLSEAKYAVGQVVIFKGKKGIPAIVLEVTVDDGEFFYRLDRKNFFHEPMLRALTVEEAGKSLAQGAGQRAAAGKEE